MKTKKQFILDTLIPYFKDRSLLSHIDGQCLYRLGDKKCAFGQHIKDEAYTPGMEGKTALDVLRDHPDCLTDEAKSQNLTPDEWSAVQRVHDNLVRDVVPMHEVIDVLEYKTGIKFHELHELANGTI